MRAEIISIGTELLLGHIVNTNTSYLSQQLARLGIDVYYHQTVGDNPGRLASTLKQAMNRSDIVITTGGLGPTVDDITVKTISEVTLTGLLFEKSILKEINSYFKTRGIKTPEDSARQAYIPEGSIWFKNKMGTAPGLIIKHRENLIIALPGPPRELMPIFEKDVIPYLKKTKGVGEFLIKSRLLKTTGLAESQVHPKVKGLLSIGPDVTCGIYARVGEVSLKITAKATDENKIDASIKKIEKQIRKRLGRYIYGLDDERLEDVVGNLLTKKKKTISVAESMTGGLLANRITDVSGSSNYFKMGCVAYSNESKINLLGVSPEKIKKYGAVSKEVALEMAKGVKRISGAHLAVAITGIAGPTGGTKKKPVGLVYIAFITDKKKKVSEFRFAGKREEIKFQATQATLDLIRKTA